MKNWKPDKYINPCYYNIEFLQVPLVVITEWWDTKKDNCNWEIGNCFKTEEEAESAIEKQKVITELKRFALENNEEEIDWNNEKQDKFFIYYNYLGSRLSIGKVNYVRQNNIYFTSEEIAKDAIKSIGEEGLKKYYLEVK